MTISDDILMAFADGELDEATRQMVEAAERDDPEVRRRIAAHRQLRARLQTAFAETLDEPVPERLLAAVRKPNSPVATVATVIRLADQRAAKSGVAPRKISIGGWPAFGSLAASILLGLGVGYAVWAWSRRTIENLIGRHRGGERNFGQGVIRGARGGAPSRSSRHDWVELSRQIGRVLPDFFAVERPCRRRTCLSLR